MSGRTRRFVRARNSEAFSRLGALIARIDEDQLKQAARRAQVSTYRSGVAMVNADVRSRYGVKLSALRGAYRVVSGRDRKREDYVAVEATGRRINLLEFAGRWSRPKGSNLKRQRSKGATAMVHAGDRKAYAGAFVASIGWRGVSGATIKEDTVRRGIFVRKKNPAGDGKRYGRGPVRLLRGPSPLEMMLGEDLRYATRISQAFRDLYTAELDRQIKLLLKR